MKQKDVLAMLAVGLVAYLVGRQLFSRDRYGLRVETEQSQMLRAQDEGITW